MSGIKRGSLLLAVFLLNGTLLHAAALEADGHSFGARKVPETLFELIVAGGPLNIGFISVLGLMSLVAVAVILERFVNLTATKLMPPGFMRELQDLITRQETNPKTFREL